MAYELLTYVQVTPSRLHALLRLSARRPGLSGAALVRLMQPESAAKVPAAAEDVLRAAIRVGLVTAPEGTSGPIELAVSPAEIEDVADYRAVLQRVAVGVSDDARPNYLLNLFTAWYAALDDAVLTSTPNEIVNGFNTNVFPTIESQQMNVSPKYPSWRTWAAFLGYGWQLGSGRPLAPDCTVRLRPFTSNWGNRSDKGTPMAEFMTRLAAHCPELDGGALFEHAWRSGRGGKERGQQLSLMLSTALRTLHDQQVIVLDRIADADDLWRLFPASGHELQVVSHIRLGEGS